MSELQAVGHGVCEPVAIDPRVASVFEMAAHYQVELDRFPAPLKKVKEMLFRLDHAWPYNQDEVLVTGIVRAPVIDVEEPKQSDEDEERGMAIDILVKDGVPETCTYFARNQSYTSFGFDARKEDMLVGRMRIGTRYIIQLALQRSVSVALPNGGMREVNLQCSADLSNVHLDFAHESPEFTAIKACESFPEEFDQIEESVLESRTVAKNIIALKNITVPRNHDTTEEAIQALGQYAEAMSQVKKEPSPFVIGTEDLVVFDADVASRAYQRIQGKGEMLVFIDGIRLTPRIDVGADIGMAPDISDNQLEFRLLFRNIGPTPERDTRPLAIRLRDIRHIRSVRQQFHEGPAALDE